VIVVIRGTIRGVTHTILIVDDDPSFREQAAELLESEGFEVVAAAADGASGLRAARELRPHFVLLDVSLPDVDGFEVARTLAIEGQPPFVILTSTRDARAYGRRLSAADVLGFIPKERISGTAIHALAARP
jgi:DNA-binding NarL/FixJ family response regulator